MRMRKLRQHKDYSDIKDHIMRVWEKQKWHKLLDDTRKGQLDVNKADPIYRTAMRKVIDYLMGKYGDSLIFGNSVYVLENATSE